MEFTSAGGVLLVNGERLHLKGTSWFGMEGGDNALHGLWSVTMDSLLDFLQHHSFNALRVPLSAELSLHLDDSETKTINFYANPGLEGLSAGGLLDLLVSKCAKRGILIMLDMHTVSSRGSICELWYDDKLDEAAVIAAWQMLAVRYKDAWNVFAADLTNEPHGCASWGSGDHATDWRLAAQRIGNAIHDVNPRLLLFVEGTSSNCCPIQAPEWASWGEALDSAAAAPVVFARPHKLVYSPHVYGPSVAAQDYFRAPDFPANMPAIWTRHWAHLKLVAKVEAAIVPGEWGGRGLEGMPDRIWMQAFANFLRDTDITDNFFWCLNPNSGDTGGLLKDDWVTPETWKLELLAFVNPSPTKLKVLPDGQVHISNSHSRAGPSAAALDLQPLAQALPSLPEICPSPVHPAPSSSHVVPAEMRQSQSSHHAGEAAQASDAGSSHDQAPSSGAVSSAEGVSVTFKTVAQWSDGTADFWHHDITVTNHTPQAVTEVLVKYPHELTTQSWNCTIHKQLDGCQVFGFPEWLLQNGGLQPGASFGFGGIFKTADPGLQVVKLVSA